MEPERSRGTGRCGARAASVAAAALLAFLALPADADEKDPDAGVLAKIESLRVQAMGIRVDGRARDWSAFPLFEDWDAAPPSHPTLNLTGIALAPREEDLLVLLQAAAIPPRGAVGFGGSTLQYTLDIDFLGLSARDASVEFGATGAWTTAVYPEGGKPSWVALPGFEVKVEDAVEVRIPLRPLAGALGDAGKAWLEGERRPFVRVSASTAWGDPLVLADDGPAAASFRLVPPPVVLDPPLRPDGEPRRAVRLPLEGKWMVRQGAHGLWTHQGIWAYDLAVVDHALRGTPVPGSKKLEDYYSYGRSVVAPEAGKIALEAAGSEDRVPLEKSAGKSSGNTLVLRFADGFRLSLGHLRKDSLAYRRDEEFPAGAAAAQVGNSGDSGAPHLHLFLSDRPGDYEGMPLAFRDVRVGLNPCPDDPWARDLPTWAVREGWFVEPR